MSMMSRTMNLPQISKILQDFERESSAMDMREEMMSEVIDDVMEDEGGAEEEESDKILKQVLDEIGISVSQQVSTGAAAVGRVFSNPVTLARRNAYWARRAFSGHRTQASSSLRRRGLGEWGLRPRSRQLASKTR